MRILVVGSGGREHALCWRISKSPLASEIYCAPGNPGTRQCATNIDVGSDDLDGILSAAAERQVDLTICGPEAPLCAGIRDHFEARGLRLVGPRAVAARLEGSKVFAKEFLHRHGIPTAAFKVFSEVPAAMDFIARTPGATVVKADGLAAGKGVFVGRDAEEAREAARFCLHGGLGKAGMRVVVEERLVGEEASFMLLTDGKRFQALAGSQDHKAAFDGDQGPNTGGMGAYSPAPIMNEEMSRRVVERVVEPTLRGMISDRIPYQGILYIGLMICDGEPYVLEFNCRLGDPETQPIMARLKTDLLPHLMGAAAGQLPEQPLEWDEQAALCVVMASPGYPGKYESGSPITGLAEAASMEGVSVFHAGTREENDRIVTAGGRVLGVTALGQDVVQARQRAYAAAELIRWPGVHYRKDIGYRAVGKGA